MTPVNLIGAIFISMAVVIAVVGQLTTIWDFLGVRRPKFLSPAVAFIGTIPFLLLLSSIVAINVVQGSSSIATANKLAQIAVVMGTAPYGFILVILMRQVPKAGVKRGRYTLKWVISLLIGGAALLVLFLLPTPLPPNGTLIVGCVFTLIPVAASWIGWQDSPDDRSSR